MAKERSDRTYNYGKGKVGWKHNYAKRKGGTRNIWQRTGVMYNRIMAKERWEGDGEHMAQGGVRKVPRGR